MRSSLAVIAITISSLAYGEGASLCKKQEQELFQCMIGHKSLSICASDAFSEGSGYVQYRFGTSTHVELKYPSTLVPPKGHFWFSSNGYSGGGEARIRFVSSGVQYTVFDRTVRTSFGPDGNFPEFTIGVGIRAPGRKDVTRQCTSGGSIKATAYDDGAFEKEEFNDEYSP